MCLYPADYRRWRKNNLPTRANYARPYAKKARHYPATLILSSRCVALSPRKSGAVGVSGCWSAALGPYSARLALTGLSLLRFTFRLLSRSDFPIVVSLGVRAEGAATSPDVLGSRAVTGFGAAGLGFGAGVALVHRERFSHRDVELERSGAGFAVAPRDVGFLVAVAVTPDAKG